jgi:pimeloyl-ACP methyl ester carboxylesterase
VLSLAAVLAGAAAWAWTPDASAGEVASLYSLPGDIFVEARGMRVRVRDEGPRGAPAVVLLHGSAASLETWNAWTERLRGQYRLIRYDQPGHGLTGPHPGRDYSAAAYADVLHQVTERLGLDRFVLVGSSMGGWVAYHYAAAHPDRVERLVLIDAYGAPDQAEVRLPLGFRIARSPLLSPLLLRLTPREAVAAGLRDSVTDPARIDAATIDRHWAFLRYPGNRQAMIDQFQSMRPDARPQQMRLIGTPTLILWGAEDRLIPAANGRWFALHIPGSRLIVYPGSGHLPMEEAPDRSAADFDAWLRATDLPRR